MQEILEKCCLCPRNCGINRNKNQIGRCKATNKVKIALYSIHQFEEPCISGKKGSGTVFFSNCNLNCIFCQNYEISQMGKGKEITIERLAEIFLEQQKRNVENINLVTPTSYVPQIIEALKIAKEKGLKIPIKLLKGYIDIYLPDLKYSDNNLAQKLSNAPQYFEIATEAIKEMIKQVGTPVFNKEGIMQKGVMIRHLVLPNNIENSKKVLKWISKELPKEIYVSIMAQYFPTEEEWDEIQNEVSNLGIENGFIQELGEHEEEYVPKWDL